MKFFIRIGVKIISKAYYVNSSLDGFFQGVFVEIPAMDVRQYKYLGILHRSDYSCGASLLTFLLTSAIVSMLSVILEMLSMVETRKQQKRRTQVISGMTVQTSAALAV